MVEGAILCIVLMLFIPVVRIVPGAKFDIVLIVMLVRIEEVIGAIGSSTAIFVLSSDNTALVSK
jgi:hypothetical protein